MPFFEGGGGHGTVVNVHPQAARAAPHPSVFHALAHAIANVGHAAAQAPKAVATPHAARRVQYPVNRPTADPRRLNLSQHPTFGRLNETLGPRQFALRQALLANHLGTVFPGLTRLPLPQATAHVYQVLKQAGYLGGGRTFDQGINALKQTVNYDDKASLYALQQALKAVANRPRSDSQGTLRYLPTLPDSLGRPVPMGDPGQAASQVPIPPAIPGSKPIPLPTTSSSRSVRQV